ncbi:hypothetical protein AB0L05_00930 [Nonomuraea pusilla]|uniref:hypothetical protein n=1 Tax=Nonomuraea pusilla TaxID=46177 RepID=UPI0033319662
MDTVVDVSPADNAPDTTLDLSSLADGSGDEERAAGRPVLPGPMVPHADLTSDDRFAVLSTLPGHLISAISSALRVGGTLVLRESGANLAAFDGPPTDTYVAPRTPIERRLTEIFEELLQAERVGIHDTFFELNGFSLLATQRPADHP